MIIAALSIAGIGLMLWLLFTFAVYALPFYVGLSVSVFAYQHDAGLIGAAVAGLFVAGGAFGVGQVLFATLRSPAARALVATVYTAPAGVAGFYAVKGIAVATGTGEPWATAFCMVGGVAVATIAWVRVSALYPGHPVQGSPEVGFSPAQPVAAANDG